MTGNDSGSVNYAINDIMTNGSLKLQIQQIFYHIQKA